MSTTVTPGKLKIIECNVQGIANKRIHITKFLYTRRKQPDIFCIVEHKARNVKMLEKLSENYKIGAWTPGPGGGVALLVHERLSGVNNAEQKFRKEFDDASRKGIEIAAIEVKLKPKGCLSGLFVFGVYRKPGNKSPLPDFIDTVCELIQKVTKCYQSTALFTGHFNINNSKYGQITRSKSVQLQLLKFQNLGYKLTHSRPSNIQGSTLNNFLVPKSMRCSQRTNPGVVKAPVERITVGAMVTTKGPDHLPVEIVISLENTGPSQNRKDYRYTFDINAPSTSTAGVGRSWVEEEGVITILDDSDEEEPDGSIGTVTRSHASNNQTNLHNIGQDVTMTRIKIEGEPRPRVDPQGMLRPAEKVSLKSFANFRDSNSTKGSDEQPRHSTKGSAEQPRHSTKGRAEQPRHSTKGSAEQPRHSTKGSAEQPRHSTKGSAEQPRHSTKGSAEQPRHSTKGSAEQPRHSINKLFSPFQTSVIQFTPLGESSSSQRTNFSTNMNNGVKNGAAQRNEHREFPESPVRSSTPLQPRSYEPGPFVTTNRSINLSYQETQTVRQKPSSRPALQEEYEYLNERKRLIEMQNKNIKHLLEIVELKSRIRNCMNMQIDQ